jgi:hypothetical protein
MGLPVRKTGYDRRVFFLHLPVFKGQVDQIVDFRDYGKLNRAAGELIQPVDATN